MNNIIIAIKRFLQNKNTVTLIGIVVVIGILYFMYNTTVNKVVQPISVPVATQKIMPGTEITSDMIKMVKIPKSGVSSNVIRSQNAVKGMYVNYTTTIPAGSMFYNEVLVRKEDLPDSTFTQVREGDVVFETSVDTKSTFGNAILPGNKVDIYIKANDDSGMVMIAKTFENIEVLAVKDSNGENVFGGETGRQPSQIIFGLSPETNILLQKAKYMSRQGVETIIVPQGGVKPEVSKDPKITSEYIKAFINSKTVVIPDETPVEVKEPEQPKEGE